MARFAGSDQRLYLKVRGSSVEGMIKVGPRELFYRDRSGRCKELAPLCVLDFFVHDKLQRQGLGKSLFGKMLLSEKSFPNKLAYDRPSPKLLKFLQTHFDLKNYIPQTNHFVIFDEFFGVVCSPFRNTADPTPSSRARPPSESLRSRRDWRRTPTTTRTLLESRRSTTSRKSTNSTEPRTPSHSRCRRTTQS